MLLFLVISIISFVICLQAGIIVFFKNKALKINRIFLFNSIVLATWSFGYVYSYMINSEQSIHIGAKIASFGWAFTPFAALLIALEFIENDFIKKTKSYFLGLLFILSTFVFYCFLIDLVDYRIIYIEAISSFVIMFSQNTLNYLCFFFFLFTLLSIVVMLGMFRARKELSSFILHQRLLLVSIALFLLFIIVYDFLLFYNLKVVNYSLSHISSLIWLLTSSHVVSRHRFIQSHQKVATETALREMRKFLVFIDIRYYISNINSYSLSLIENKKEDVVGAFFPDMFADRDLVESYLDKAMAGQQIASIEISIMSQSKKEIPLELSFSLINDEFGDSLGIVVFGDNNTESIRLREEIKSRHELEIKMNEARELLNQRVNSRTRELVKSFQELQVKVTERMKVEEQIKADITEKEFLISEILNRVKSNMKIIIALIEAQSNCNLPGKAQLKFRELSNRVNSILLVQEYVYLSISYSYVDFASFTKDLVEQLFVFYDCNETVKLRLDISDVYLNIDFAIPLGIVMNELISNSLSHAYVVESKKFENGHKPELIVSYKYYEGKYEVIIADNGIGLPSEDILKTKNTTGLPLVNILVNEQINGKMNITSSTEGTTFKISFNDTI